MRPYHEAMRRLIALVAVLLCPCAWGADRLPALSAELTETSVSGLSSGAYMAVQFHVAHASIVKGAGIFAGGLWGCAKGNADRATGECSQGSPSAKPFVDAATEAARQGTIDSPAALARSRVWLFSGSNDGVVRQSATDALVDFYRALLPGQQVFYRNDLAAGHALVTLDHGDRCELTGGQFIAACGYDAAGALLQFIYGRLAPPGTPSNASLRPFDQTEFAVGGARSTALADEGYVYIPKTCASTGGCRTHVALHGCRQSAESVGDAFYRYAGYNQWAETNRIIVVYPQARATWGMPLNPYGCWDWWGYTGSGYLTKAAPQIAALRAMVDRVASGSNKAVAAPAPTPGPKVIDASSTALAVAWNPVAGAVRYELAVAGRTIGVPSPQVAVAVDGLAAATPHALTWRAQGASGQVLAEVRLDGATTARPRACDPWLANNVAHVRAGRAYVLWGLTYALGSNQPMGWWNIFTTTQLHRIPGGFSVGPCP